MKLREFLLKKTNVTDVETIWHWFDEHHSKGVGWLMNEYER